MYPRAHCARSDLIGCTVGGKRKEANCLYSLLAEKGSSRNLSFRCIGFSETERPRGSSSSCCFS
jgi:hypothetical protein